jgi:hypothetical protein
LKTTVLSAEATEATASAPRSTQEAASFGTQGKDLLGGAFQAASDISRRPVGLFIAGGASVPGRSRSAGA